MGMKIWTQLEAVRQELDIHRLINNENCIRLYEVIEDTSEDPSNEKIYAVLELAKYKEIMIWDENANKFIPNQVLIKPGEPNLIKEHDIIKIMKDLTMGLKYLHLQAGIVHRDIKPQNILI